MSPALLDLPPEILRAVIAPLPLFLVAELARSADPYVRAVALDRFNQQVVVSRHEIRLPFHRHRVMSEDGFRGVYGKFSSTNPLVPRIRHLKWVMLHVFDNVKVVSESTSDETIDMWNGVCSELEVLTDRMLAAAFRCLAPRLARMENLGTLTLSLHAFLSWDEGAPIGPVFPSGLHTLTMTGVVVGGVAFPTDEWVFPASLRRLTLQGKYGTEPGPDGFPAFPAGLRELAILWMRLDEHSKVFSELPSGLAVLDVNHNLLASLLFVSHLPRQLEKLDFLNNSVSAITAADCQAFPKTLTRLNMSLNPLVLVSVELKRLGIRIALFSETGAPTKAELRRQQAPAVERRTRLRRTASPTVPGVATVPYLPATCGPLLEVLPRLVDTIRWWRSGSRVSKDMFQRFDRLRTLDLTSCYIHSMDSVEIPELVCLLNLSNNQLKHVPRQLRDLPRLTKLDLSNNSQFGTLDMALIPQLVEQLLVAFCGVDSIVGTFEHLQKLRVLRLDGCSVHLAKVVAILPAQLETFLHAHQPWGMRSPCPETPTMSVFPKALRRLRLDYNQCFLFAHYELPPALEVFEAWGLDWGVVTRDSKLPIRLPPQLRSFRLVSCSLGGGLRPWHRCNNEPWEEHAKAQWDKKLQYPWVLPSGLLELDLRANYLTELPPPGFLPRGLVWLNLSGNYIGEFPVNYALPPNLGQVGLMGRQGDVSEFRRLHPSVVVETEEQAWQPGNQLLDTWGVCM